MPDKLLSAGLCCFDCNPHLNRVLAPAFGALEDEPVVAGFGRLCDGEPRPRCAVRTRSIKQRTHTHAAEASRLGDSTTDK
jgi:hypothetical protein